MCLILFAYKCHPHYRLVLAANRDEFYDRPTLPLHYWQAHPDILAGQDLQAQGTWLGVTRSGRLAAITNFREPLIARGHPPSRGELVKNFLTGSDSPEEYLRKIQVVAQDYYGFNLLVGAADSLWYFSNRGSDSSPVTPGIHGISNHLMDTPWPKVVKGKAGLSRILDRDRVEEESLFQLLSDRDYPPANQLPDTGVGADWERTLSPLFITSAIYGTRSSSLVLITQDFTITVIERSFFPPSTDQAAPITRRHDFLCKGAGAG